MLTQDVVFAAGAGERQTTVVYRPTETGLKRYEFLLHPQSSGRHGAERPNAGERYGVNVQVIDDKIEVLVLEDRWRWEFKYLKRVLEDDPSFNFTAMLARGDGAFLQMGEPERRVNLGSFPQSRAELDWFDVLVLGDVRPTRWPSGLSGAVADAVIEGGKSLIVVAGPSLGEFAQSPELHTLLPVELSLDSAAPIEGPLDVRLTPDGAQSGIFADGDLAATVALPAVDRIYRSAAQAAGSDRARPSRRRGERRRQPDLAGRAHGRPRPGAVRRHRCPVEVAGFDAARRRGPHALWKILATGAPRADAAAHLGRVAMAHRRSQPLRSRRPRAVAGRSAGGGREPADEARSRGRAARSSAACR